MKYDKLDFNIVFSYNQYNIMASIVDERKEKEKQFQTGKTKMLFNAQQ